MNTPKDVEEMVNKILDELPRYAMTREDKMWGLEKLSNGAYADISDLDEILTETLKESEDDIRLLTEEIEHLRKDVENARQETLKEAVKAIEGEKVLVDADDLAVNNLEELQKDSFNHGLSTAITTLKWLDKD